MYVLRFGYGLAAVLQPGGIWQLQATELNLQLQRGLMTMYNKLYDI
jgi:hypothetical protein